MYRFLPVRDPGDVGWLDGALEMRNTYHFNRLIPASGSAETVKGELLRAVNRMVYRFYNDGDGITSSAGPAQAHSYLTGGSHPLTTQMQEIFSGEAPLSDTRFLQTSYGDQMYIRQMVTALELVLDFIEEQPGDVPNQEDYLDFDYPHSECRTCGATYDDEEAAEECCSYAGLLMTMKKQPKSAVLMSAGNAGWSMTVMVNQMHVALMTMTAKMMIIKEE
jgi:hypothetical protein